MDIDLSKYDGSRSFRKDLQYSLDASEEDFWSAVYTEMFPNLLHMELCKDAEKQKQGIDRALYLNNQNVQWVDEKKRDAVYSDILLEHTSNVERGTPGWMEKDLCIDYLAYAFMPICTCYLFPWPMLRRAWLQYKEAWCANYFEVAARTRLANGEFYTTHSVAVPIVVLQNAVTNSAVIDVTETLRIKRSNRRNGHNPYQLPLLGAL
jgi:hypothetical protein